MDNHIYFEWLNIGWNAEPNALELSVFVNKADVQLVEKSEPTAGRKVRERQIGIWRTKINEY